MKFILKGSFKENVRNLMRRAGYYFQREDIETSELIFVRPPRNYPRFHIYLKIEDENLILTLHLDQKKPIYEGVPAHSGEYKGKVVENEAERIKEVLKEDAKN